MHGWVIQIPSMLAASISCNCLFFGFFPIPIILLVTSLFGGFFAHEPINFVINSVLFSSVCVLITFNLHTGRSCTCAK